MFKRLTKFSALPILLFALPAVASATTYTYDGKFYQQTEFGKSASYSVSFDSVSQIVDFSFTSNLDNGSFYAAVNSGGNPKGNGGELPMFFGNFENNALEVSVYDYQNGIEATYQKGTFLDNSSQAGTNLSNLSVSKSNGLTTASFSYDATSIIYDKDTNPNSFYKEGFDERGNLVKFGPGFSDLVGTWVGLFRADDIVFDIGSNGTIRPNQGLDYNERIWSDTSYRQTHEEVPEPGTLALFGLGMLGVALRRRKAPKQAPAAA